MIFFAAARASGVSPPHDSIVSLCGEKDGARDCPPPKKRNMRRTERQKEYVTIAIVMKSREAETNDKKAHVHPMESLYS